LIYLANLQSVPQELLEAARIDGANRAQVFANVTWPMLAGAVTVNMTLSMIAGWTIFDQVMVLTSGGPGCVSCTMAFFLDPVGVGEYRAGFGSAAAVLLFLVVIVSTVAANPYMRKREIQSGQPPSVHHRPRAPARRPRRGAASRAGRCPRSP